MAFRACMPPAGYGRISSRQERSRNGQQIEGRPAAPDASGNDAATNRAAREILRSEAEARKDLTARLNARRIKKEAEERRDER
jgi:hypothetical protein